MRPDADCAHEYRVPLRLIKAGTITVDLSRGGDAALGEYEAASVRNMLVRRLKSRIFGATLWRLVSEHAPPLVRRVIMSYLEYCGGVERVKEGSEDET